MLTVRRAKIIRAAIADGRSYWGGARVRHYYGTSPTDLATSAYERTRWADPMDCAPC